MMSKKRLSVRIPEKLHNWLKDNIKDKTMNDYIVDLIRKDMETAKNAEEAKATEKARLQLKPQIRDLLDMRKLITKGKQRECNSWGGVEDIKTRFSYLDAFETLEDFYLGDRFFNEDEIEAMKQKIGETAWKQYFEVALKLSSGDCSALLNEIEKIAEYAICEGDSEEVVTRGVTRGAVYEAFNKNEKYTISDVAGKLGVTYMQAYNNVVPWMRNQGFTIEQKS
jgi:Arc/MetJ-type ribon-helix-helix transcriptional regulator